MDEERVKRLHTGWLQFMEQPPAATQKASWRLDATGCYVCRERLIPNRDLTCARCGYFVCHNCGACMCGKATFDAAEKRGERMDWPPGTNARLQRAATHAKHLRAAFKKAISRE